MLLSSCHIPTEGNGDDLIVKNATTMTLTVGEPGEIAPNAPRKSNSGFPAPVIVKPGEIVSLFVGLYSGCKRIRLAAYDQAGHLVAALPTPICADKHSHGYTWTIKQP